MVDLQWDTESDWASAQETQDIEIDGTVFRLAEINGLNHIETQTANGDSTIDFTNVFASDDGYERYVVFVDNLIPANNAVSLILRYSSDGGSNWDSGASDYAYARFRVAEDGGTSSVGSSGDGEIFISLTTIGNDPSNNDTFGTSFVISNPTNANRATVERGSHNRYRDSDTNVSFSSGFNGGIRLTQSAVDSIRLQMDGGNISSGIFSVYGVSQ